MKSVKPIIDLKPELAVLQVSSLSQSMKEVSTTDISPCTQLHKTRLMHEIVIRNHNFSIKHLFKLTYTTDSDSALICGKNQSCGREVVREFPGRQIYWSGERKSISELLCWFATLTNRDFNLQVQIDDQPYSLGIEPKALEQLNDQISLIAHCEFPESSFDD